MPLVNVIVVLILVGTVLWAVNTLISNAQIKKVVTVVVVVLFVLWIVAAVFGVNLSGTRLPVIR